MNFTYIASDNTAGDAAALGAAGQDVRVSKLIFGTLVDGDIVKLYNKAAAFGHTSGIGSTDPDDIAAQITVPTAGEGKNWDQVLDFGPEGITLDGGAVHTDATALTVLWELASESE